MDRLRRIIPLLAVLLTFVVGGESTDLLPCADAGCGAWDTLLDPGSPPPGGGEPGPAACLCQVTFTPSAALPAAPAPAPRAGALWGAEPAHRSSPSGRVPHPPPRG